MMIRNKAKNKPNKNATSNKKAHPNKNVKGQDKNNADLNARAASKSENVQKSNKDCSAGSSSSSPNPNATCAKKASNPPPATKVQPLPSPPPDPVFVLRASPCSVPISSVTFLSPALRLDELTPSQCDVLAASYGTSSGGGIGQPPLKMPPPGFLTPTTHIAAGLLNGQIIVWDLKTKHQTLCWQAHPQTSSVLSVKSITPTQLVSLGGKDCLKLWTLETAKESDEANASSTTYLAGSTPVCTVQVPLADYLGFSDCDVFKHSNCIVAAIPGQYQDAVSVWSLTDKIKICQLRFERENRTGSVMQLKWIEKRGTVALAVAYEAGQVYLWNWTNTDVHSSVQVTGTPLCIEYDQNLGTGIIGTAQENLFLFTISNNYEMSLVREITLINEGIGCCISRPDSKIYVTGGWDNSLRVFSWHKSKLLAVLEFHTNSISCLHYTASRVASYEGRETSVDGKWLTSAGTEHMLAAGSLDGSISLWKMY